MTVDADQKPARDRVFMDISIGGLPSGRLIFELFNDVAPKTAENFRALCAGDMGIGISTGKPLTYKGMVFHRVVKDFMIQGGDFTNSNGTGGESIYGGTFEDENFELQHDKPFLLSMANRGKDTNGSQFFITTQPAPHLDNVHVVFGSVIGGATLVRQLETLPVDRNARPLQDVTVANCGQLIKLQAGKKRKGKEIKEESCSEAEKHVRKDEKKKKKKDKKEKKKKRRRSASLEEGETPEAPSHPLVMMTSKIDPKDIPDVPTNRFLMREGRDQDKNDPRKDRERMRFRERERNSYTRSGRIIKGRGVFRYRTPSRSRSRSRSVTPPHWRMAQRRIIKLSEFERLEQERSELEQQEAAKRPSQVHLNRDEGGTPEQPQEKEEGECDSTIDGPRHERIDYNALDFEEDVDDEESEPPFRRVPERASRRRERRRDVSPTQSRAEVLARALGVNPNRAKEIISQHRDTRRGLPSTIQAAPKMSSAVAQASDFHGHGHGQGLGQSQGLDQGQGLGQGGSSATGHSDGYDPFSLLRSTFRSKDQGQGSAPKNDRPDRFNQERADRADRFQQERTDRHKDARPDRERRDHTKGEREGRSRRHSDKDKPNQSKEKKERDRNTDGDSKDAKNQDEDEPQKIEKPPKSLLKHILLEDGTKEKNRDGNKEEANGKSDQNRAISQDRTKRTDSRERGKRKDSRDKEDMEKRRERSKSIQKRRERSSSKGRDDGRRDRSKNRDDNKMEDRRRDRSAEKRRDRSRSLEKRRDRSRSRNKNRRTRSRSKGQDKRRDRSRSHEKRRDRSRSHEKRRDRSRSLEKRRDRSRSQEKRPDRSEEKRRDRSRSKNDYRKKRSSRSRSKSRSPRKQRSRSRDRMPSTSENLERSNEKSPTEDKKEEQDDARKELMEIVRLIKSRQKDRESKAAVKTTGAKSISQSDGSPGEKERRRSTDRDGDDRKRSDSPRRRANRSSRRSGSRRDDRRSSSR